MCITDPNLLSDNKRDWLQNPTGLWQKAAPGREAGLAVQGVQMHEFWSQGGIPGL